MLGLTVFLESRPMHLALHAMALLGLSSLVLSAVATPVPLPLPLMTADYSLRLAFANRSTPLIAPRRLQSLALIPPIYSRTSRRFGLSKSNRAADPLEELSLFSSAATRNADSLSKRGAVVDLKLADKNSDDLAANSGNIDNDDLDFQQQYTSTLSDFNDNVQAFQAALANAASDKGLANYDKQNDLEKLLKEIVNAHKNVLSCIDKVVENIPGLGPVLGPSTPHCPLRNYCLITNQL